ncbi:polysaccharide deacetylase family protein [Paenibacillus aestuarii]|uniref:DUF4163 domain-containing protein n=1 Tax=Paenibacillus aestuarii TaxID=516965 RepID=A0ABW0KAP8_9BACL|nr:hypothetical protein [Paenibacillus aestuarii]
MSTTRICKQAGLLLVLSFVFMGCSPNGVTVQALNPANQAAVQEYEVVSEDYENGAIHIRYPQLRQLNAPPERQQMINALLRAEALKGQLYDKDTTQPYTLDIDFTVTLRSSKLLSVQYRGSGYVEGAAHPNPLFYTTNVDLVRGNRLRLEDLVPIDRRLVHKFKRGRFKALNPLMASLHEQLSKDELVRMFQRADDLDRMGTEDQSDTFSYLTKEALGISIGVGYAAGGHAEFEIRYADLTKTFNQIQNEKYGPFR